MPVIVPQSIVAKLTRAAIFLVVDLQPAPSHEAVVKDLCGDMSSLLRGIGFRDSNGALSCVMGFGSTA